jgi:hypothetical protein
MPVYVLLWSGSRQLEANYVTAKPSSFVAHNVTCTLLYTLVRFGVPTEMMLWDQQRAGDTEWNVPSKIFCEGMST